MKTNRQLETSKKAGIATVCASFVVLLLMVLLLEGIPTTGQLINIILGSLFMGFWGYQLGSVIGSPTVIKRKTYSNVKKKEKQAFYEDSLKPSTPNNNTTLEESEDWEETEATGLNALQNAIPETDIKTSEHEWRELSSLDATTDETNKTKAFEA
jgi:hypothetical protein